MSDFLRKLAPTRSPVLAIVIACLGVPLWLSYGRTWTGLLGLDQHAAGNTVAAGTLVTILIAVILYGLTSRFRTSTSRMGVRLPRCVIVFYWIVAWVVFVLDTAGLRWQLPIPVGVGLAVLALLALIFLVIGFFSPDDVADRRLRAGAPPLYRALAWAGLLFGPYAMSALDHGSLSTATGWSLLTMCIALFFLAYLLDERWYRNQLLPAEYEAASSTDEEECVDADPAA